MDAEPGEVISQMEEQGAGPAPCCPTCAGGFEVWYEGVFDDRYGYPGYFTLLRCPNCALAKTWPALRDADLPTVYSHYYPRADLDPITLTSQMRNPASLAGRWRVWLSGAGNQGHYYATPGMKVLDYGCGMGVSLLELRVMGVEGYGIDVDPNAAGAAAHLGLNIHIGSLGDGVFGDTQFDLISLNQVIEHVPEPSRLLVDLSKRLNPGGLVILSFPNVDSLMRRLTGRAWIHWHVPYHIHHFSLRSFTKLCERVGWKVVRWKTVTPNLWTLLQLGALRQRTRMGEASSLWIRPSGGDGVVTHTGRQRVAAFLRKVRTGIRLVLRMPVLGTVAVTNRILDLLGVGDSLLVFIQPRDGAMT